MTAPLDEKGWEATMRRIRDYTMDAESKKWWLRFCEAQQDLHAAEAQVLRLTEENEAQRKVVSECAASLMNGAAISMESSIDFMKLLPTEIQMVILAYKTRIKTLEGALREISRLALSQGGEE